MYIVSKQSPFLVKMNLENNQIVNKIEDGLDQMHKDKTFALLIMKLVFLRLVMEHSKLI